ncbi:MAG: SDR family NAD(P)-dependent oxidoreductase [Trichocoleus desertorum ATA4-8-CV12]|jgi:short-subunit dehydrogenase|nr:SDR family NAD(P)-dependent oxidoreductase [Trichocoleus desertorum ATA4-8-CV12]
MDFNYSSLLSLIVGAIAVWICGLPLDRWWRERSYDLTGKTILMTGGSRGLGLVMARQLIQQGARLAICARDEAELERARHELVEQRGGEVLALPCDVTDQAQVEQLVQQVRDRFGAIDILINNAGTDIVGPMDTLTLQDYDDAMKLHFWAPLYTTYAVLPEMRQRREGRIVNVSSIGGKVVSPHMVAYCASKFALTGLSEAMRTELDQEGITVTTVCPGFIRTGVVDHVIVKGQNRKEFAWFSIGDSLPFISTSAENVARQTIAALRRGDAEIVISFPAWLTVRLYGLFPGLTTNLLSLANRLLPKTGGIGPERALGRDSHSLWSPSWLTFLSNRAARRNNEIPVAEPGTQIGSDSPSERLRQRSLNPVEIGTDPLNAPIEFSGERSNQQTVERERSPEIAQTDPEATQSTQIAEITPEIQACFEDIQDTLGIPWVPASWRDHAAYPAVMQLFWQRLKPAMQTEAFLQDAIAITEHIYRDIIDWYQPGYQVDVNEAERHRIQRELNAFIFGNSQLLIQQIALSRALGGEIVGQDGNTDPRHGPNAYRHTKIQMTDGQTVPEISEEMQQVYQDIKQILGIAIVSPDYQALARWSTFFLPAWKDLKSWRDRPEYQFLIQEVVRRSEEAANHLSSTVLVGEREVRDLLDNPDDFDQIQQRVQMFKGVLPELIVQDALFHMALSGAQSVATP